MENLVNVASVYGPLGLMLLGCSWYILHRDKMHREERKELTTVLERQHREALEANRHTTTVLTEISTLIKSRVS